MLQWLFGKKKQQPLQNKKKQQKPQKQQDDKWMYQFMIQFLSSPIWRVSILDFVDNKCIIFDNQQQNKFEYTLTHNQFKQLVGNLVDGMMQQIGLSEQKLAQLIQKGFQSKQIKLFNQLLLADDFLRFKDLMVKRNKALQQQAIKALQQSKNPSNNRNQKNQSKFQQQKKIIKQQAINKQQKLKQIRQQQQQMLRRAIQMSKIQAQQKQALKQLQSKVFDQQSKKQQAKAQQPVIRKQQLKQVKQRSSKLQPLKGTSKVSSQLSDLPPLSVPKAIFIPKNQLAAVKIKQQIKPIVLQQKQQQLSIKQKQQSLQDRKQRLIAQRQKIRKQKEQQRKKHLQNDQPQKILNIHAVVLQDDGIHDTQIGVKKEQAKIQTVPNKVTDDQIKRRKELMNKIKNRIIDDF